MYCRISRVRENICATDFSRHDVRLVIIHFQPVASHPVSHRFWARLDVHQQFSKVLGAGRFVQLRVLCKQVVHCVVVPNDMAQCRDVDGEQHRARRRALRYTVLQHCRLGRPTSNQHRLITVSQTGLQPSQYYVILICPQDQSFPSGL